MDTRSLASTRWCMRENGYDLPAKVGEAQILDIEDAAVADVGSGRGARRDGVPGMLSIGNGVTRGEAVPPVTPVGAEPAAIDSERTDDNIGKGRLVADTKDSMAELS